MSLGGSLYGFLAARKGSDREPFGAPKQRKGMESVSEFGGRGGFGGLGYILRGAFVCSFERRVELELGGQSSLVDGHSIFWLKLR